MTARQAFQKEYSKFRKSLRGHREVESYRAARKANSTLNKMHIESSLKDLPVSLKIWAYLNN